jgi:hypothetical protein
MCSQRVHLVHMRAYQAAGDQQVAVLQGPELERLILRYETASTLVLRKILDFPLRPPAPDGRLPPAGRCLVLPLPAACCW